MEKKRKVSPWIDISVPLVTGMAHWPGDPPTVVSRVSDLERGDPFTVSRLELSAHAGTHLDAPAHCIAGGATMDQTALDAAIGTARVLPVAGPVPLTAAALEPYRIRRGQRILLKTAGAAPGGTRGGVLTAEALSPEAAEYLAERQVALVGVDRLSVGGLAAHRALLGAGVVIVEGLDLSLVEPGAVRLICLPLRLARAEGAPARAIARSLARRRAAK